MQVECECCKVQFWMSKNCMTKHPKCQYCRKGFNPEESVIQNEMDECWELFIECMTGQSWRAPNPDFILLEWNPAKEAPSTHK